ncbi:amidase [Acuticoccus sp. M5D2P5]|uniref:amidase n=1 Tax=Acuticoccus kalidii TaxID=2910977 RepID=UPI001F279FA3|nr:amidase [Acuticoccus kalidii]
MFNAFSHVDAEGALAAASASEARWQAGRPIGPLDGVPVTIKDLTLTRGLPTYKGSATTPVGPPWDDDAPIAAHLREAGAITIGKTTSPEFGWKGVTDSPRYGIARNPWNKDLTPGGSSGGAGIAAALGLGLLHQGSDAGGSIRIPGAFTGTFGLKPTFGYIPQWPASAMTTLSHLGPMTRSATDAALMMTILARPDPRDGYAGLPCTIDWTAPPPADLAGLRIGYSRDLGYVSVAPDIVAAVDAAVEALQGLGAEIVMVDPGFADPQDVFNTFWSAGAARLLGRIDPAERDRVDPGFRAIAEDGARLTLSDYMAAEEDRMALRAHMAAFHETFDLLVTPTMPIAPFAAGRDVPDGGPYRRWMDWTPFTYPFNITQQPAATVPCGLDGSGLPVGVQLVAARFRDDIVMNAARLLEQRLPVLSPPLD